MANTSRIERNGKIYLLAYDQGMEHGPTDFNDLNYHPNHIIKIALEGDASCIALQYGTAKQFYQPELRKKLPLILKLNGKSGLYSANYQSALLSNVEDAVKLGAAGVGFTIFPGQKDEHLQFEQFAEIRRAAEKAGLITVLWSYARGPEIEDQFDRDVVAYAARIAAELGADIAKFKYPGSPEALSWAIKNALNTKVIVSGTGNFGKNYVSEVKGLMSVGAAGLAVGRKIWQDDNAVELSKEVANAIYNS